MGIGQRIEQIRQEQKIPVYIMCNHLMIESEAEYQKIISGIIQPTIFQQIMVIVSTQSPLF